VPAYSSRQLIGSVIQQNCSRYTPVQAGNDPPQRTLRPGQHLAVVVVQADAVAKDRHDEVVQSVCPVLVRVQPHVVELQPHVLLPGSCDRTDDLTHVGDQLQQDVFVSHDGFVHE